MARQEIYVSTDVETDGPIEGVFSMRSIGSAAYTADGNMIDTFTDNLLPLPGAMEYEPTIDWYKTEAPQAWAALLVNADHPDRVMRRYYDWLKALPGSPVFVGYPVAFDFAWVRWYLHRFIGYDQSSNPFSHSALDIKTMAMIALQKGYRDSTKKNMPKEWFNPELKHTHFALDDAIEQGHLFFSIKRILDAVVVEHGSRKTFYKYNLDGNNPRQLGV